MIAMSFLNEIRSHRKEKRDEAKVPDDYLKGLRDLGVTLPDGGEKIDGIADIVFRREILGGNGSGNRYLGYYQRGYHPPRGEDFIVRPCEYCLFTTSKTGTSHGTPYVYDTHVPIVFWGSGISVKQVARVVHTVDIAPTIARLLGIAPLSSVDGKVLKEIVR